MILLLKNPFEFSTEEINIIFNWKYFIKGTFFLVRYRKQHAIFLSEDSPQKAYGVLAITDYFDNMLGPNLPIMLESVLLPFKGNIIYDGLISSHRITFGPRMRKTFNNSYQEAKSKFGIITSLPFSVEETTETDIGRLKYYLKSERNFEIYQDQIWELIDKNPSFLVLYHQIRGKVHARKYGKELREIGFRDSWFAILENLIIASGKTKDEVERVLKGILPPGKEKFVYLFQLKG